MKIHHLNLASLRVIDSVAGTAPSVCHALLVDLDTSLVLVEAGLGLDDVERPAETLDPEWVTLVEPRLDPAEAAIHQIARLGYDPRDVRDIVVTHLDVDHSGGLPDFPHARVHVLVAELDAALTQAPTRRYRPAHWAHTPKWVTYDETGGEEWFTFPGVHQLDALPPDILLVPLPGHSAGHAGVAVRDGDRWLLHAGDAYFYHRELDPEAPHGHPLMDLVQHDSQVDEPARLTTQARLRTLARDHGDQVAVINAHDPWTFARHQD